MYKRQGGHGVVLHRLTPINIQGDDPAVIGSLVKAAGEKDTCICLLYTSVVLLIAAGVIRSRAGGSKNAG